MNTITCWWSATDQLFITQLLDEEGNQIDAAEFAGNRYSAAIDVYWKQQAHPEAALDIPASVRRAMKEPRR